MTHRASVWFALWSAALVLVGCGGGSGGEAPDAACTTQKFYPDVDHDGFGDSAKAVDMCEAPPGFITKGGDCRDSDAAVHPGAPEVCDQVDNNCDGKIDDADPLLVVGSRTAFYRDHDGDSFGDPSAMMMACAQPSGYVTDATDCNDNAAAVNPSALEICDQIDNDCDGLVDLADPSLDLSTTHSYYRDADHDNYGAGAAMVACSAPTGFVLASGDCNDNDVTSHPGGTEVCDGADNDCDGGIDGTIALPNRCTALVGTYGGSYTHTTNEKVGTTIVNQMMCSGTGSGALVLGRTPALQGTFTCIYTGGLTLFSHTQQVTIKASVGLDGHVTGTVDHVYNTTDNLRRTYNVTGTQTATTLTLTGTGSWFPNAMSAVAWGVTFSFSAAK